MSIILLTFVTFFCTLILEVDIIKKIIIIAAVGKNLELGKDNNLIWKLSGDMKFFKNITMNKNIVMGYNTFKSLPNLLPGRKHIILTHNKIDNPEVKTFSNFPNLMTYLNELDEDIYIIGGASIYNLFINIADEIVLTEINDICHNADVYFPNFDKNNWNVINLCKVDEGKISYNHVKYLRK